MIKKIVVLVITFLYFFHCFAFEVDTNFSTRCPHDVIKIDERLTTVAAHKTMTLLGVSAEKKKKIVDTISAEYILQMYLDKNS